VRSSWWRVLGLIVVAVLPLGIVLLAGSDAEAQCSMCRAALNNAANAKFIRNLNIGVLVLFVPPVAIFCTLFIALKRFKPQMNADDADLKRKADPR